MTGLLAAAFPRDWVGEGTEEVYVQRLARLERFDIATAAVNMALDTAQRLPSIASVRETYLRILQTDERFRRPALPEPELSDREREENVRRMRGLVEGLRADLPEVPRPEPVVVHANVVLADGPGKGTHLTLDGAGVPLGLPAVIHVPLPDPRIDAEALAAELAGVDDPVERRRLRRQQRRRSAVYERTDRRVAGVTHYRFRDWVPDEDGS